MKNRIFPVLLIAFLTFFLNPNCTKASHLFGGEISYEYVTNNQYIVKLALYRYCSAVPLSVLSFDIEVRSSCMNLGTKTLYLESGYPQNTTQLCANALSTCDGGTEAGYEVYLFSDTIQLPFACSDWTFSWHFCCRPGAINIGANQAFYIEATLNNLVGVVNHGATFYNHHYPSSLLTHNNGKFYINATAYDLDNDELRYRLEFPMEDTAQSINIPSGYWSQLQIDSITGLIEVDFQVGLSFPIAIKVEEYRNGQLIGSMRRDLVHFYDISGANYAPYLDSVNHVSTDNVNTFFQITNTQTFSVDLKFLDSAVINGSQIMNSALTGNISGGTYTFDSTTLTGTFQWTPTLADTGSHSFLIYTNDNGCPRTGFIQTPIVVQVFPSPQVSSDDDFFTIFQGFSFQSDVAVNDYSNIGKNISLLSSVNNGTLILQNNGQFVYASNPNFTGIDSFTYEICGIVDSTVCDTSTAYIIVNPAILNPQDDYINTPINQPILGNFLQNDTINLPVQITPFVTPTLGIFSFNQQGNFIYTPNDLAYGTDQISLSICDDFTQQLCDTTTIFVNIQQPFFINDTIVLGESYPNYYCLSDSTYYLTDTLQNAVLTFVNDSCVALYGDYLGTDTTVLQSSFETVFLQLTVENGVWPGDTDDDALVNNFDLLNIGIAYNSTGSVRDSQTIAWNGYLANNWSLAFANNSLDYKHADADGNGVVNDNDTLAITQNWGLSYNKNGGGTGIPLYLNTDSITISNDSIISIPIMLGTVQDSATSIYGVAFSIEYDSDIVAANSTYVDFHSNWLNTNQNTISIQKYFTNSNLIETAITRIDGNNTHGFGQIGTFHFKLKNNVNGLLFNFETLNTKGVENDGTTVDIQGEQRSILWQSIDNLLNNTNAINLSNHLQIYPNPATDYLTISTKTVTIESIEIFDMTGRKVVSEYSWNNRNQLNISQLNEGFYIVHIQTDLGVWNEKIMVVKP